MLLVRSASLKVQTETVNAKPTFSADAGLPCASKPAGNIEGRAAVSRPDSTRAPKIFFTVSFSADSLLHFVDEMRESCYKEGFYAVCSRVQKALRESVSGE